MNLIVLMSTYTNYFNRIIWYSPYFCVPLQRFRKTFASLGCTSTKSKLSVLGLHKPCYHNMYLTINLYKSMENNQSSMGRMELAQSYFPFILPRSAWQKFKSLLLDYPDLAVFAKQRRRTFLPSEVNIIYQRLGHP